MSKKSGSRRSPRSIPIAGEELKRYLLQRGRKISEALRQQIRRGRMDRGYFVTVMQDLRIPREDWYRFLPMGGVDGIEPPPGSSPEGKRVLVWFPHGGHVTGGGYSPLSWAGAGVNDFVETISSVDRTDAAPVSRVPLAGSLQEPALRIQFRHRVVGLNPRDSWWSAVIGFSAGPHPPEWQTVDLTRYQRIKVYLRAHWSKAKGPISVYLRFEDDHIIDVNGQSLHSSSGWSRRPIEASDWLRPNWLELDSDFDWGAKAFWQTGPSVDRQKVLQITIGMDGDMPDDEGCIDIERIELHADDMA